MLAHIYEKFPTLLLYPNGYRVQKSFRLCGRRRGWDGLREQHRNMYII